MKEATKVFLSVFSFRHHVDAVSFLVDFSLVCQQLLVAFISYHCGSFWGMNVLGHSGFTIRLTFG